MFMFMSYEKYKTETNDARLNNANKRAEKILRS